jgi:hypothetical protein
MGWFLLRHPAPKPAQPKVAQTIQPIPPPPPTPTVKSPVIATFLLNPGGVRGDGDANEISLPPGATQVRFRIDLPANEHNTYEVSLNRVEGQPLFVQKNISAHASKNGVTLFVVVPASSLPTGVSILTLKGGLQVLSKYVIRRYL